MADKQEHWQVKKDVPLALILTFVGGIAIQSFALGYWASGQNARLVELEKSQAATEKKLEGMANLAERLVRVETKTDGVISALTEVKDLLRRPGPSAR